MQLELLLLVAVGLALFFWIQRSSELFSLSWRKGELRLIRGRIPPMLKADLAEALSQMKVARCTVTARMEETRARLSVSGMDDFSAQRLRNIFQLYPMSQLRNAAAPAHGKLLRWFGMGALVWIFGRSED